jgi:hypothetical protein
MTAAPRAHCQKAGQQPAGHSTRTQQSIIKHTSIPAQNNTPINQGALELATMQEKHNSSHAS